MDRDRKLKQSLAALEVDLVRVTLAIAELNAKLGHATDEDLERYILGKVQGPELEKLEEHLFGCATCAERAEKTAEYVDAIRAALMTGRVRPKQKTMRSGSS